MGRVKPETRGLFREVFDNGKFKGAFTLERIVLDFTVRKYDPRPGLATPESGVAETPFWYMPIVYRAFSRPKKVLFWNISNVVALSSLNMQPWHFDGRYMTAEDYVEFVTKEAEALARAFNLPVEVVYHGDPFFARKYLLQARQNPKQGLS
ncbi:hypothetical protein HYU20_03560 [Candidatus Woesearchaeota archaeon]|nr:hypothetical protein [Candidatus Woesearchaeota archaeon]